MRIEKLPGNGNPGTCQKSCALSQGYPGITPCIAHTPAVPAAPLPCLGDSALAIAVVLCVLSEHHSPRVEVQYLTSLMAVTALGLSQWDAFVQGMWQCSQTNWGSLVKKGRSFSWGRCCPWSGEGDKQHGTCSPDEGKAGGLLTLGALCCSLRRPRTSFGATGCH